MYFTTIYKKEKGFSISDPTILRDVENVSRVLNLWLCGFGEISCFHFLPHSDVDTISPHSSGILIHDSGIK